LFHNLTCQFVKHDRSASSVTLSNKQLFLLLHRGLFFHGTQPVTITWGVGQSPLLNPLVGVKRFFLLEAVLWNNKNTPQRKIEKKNENSRKKNDFFPFFFQRNSSNRSSQEK